MGKARKGHNTLGDLTPGELRQLRYLLGKAGLGFKGLPPPRRRGAKVYDRDADMLPALELFLRLAQRERGMSRTAALRWWAESCRTGGGNQLFGASADAVARRLAKKLKAIGAAERELEWCRLPAWPGIDLSKVTLG